MKPKYPFANILIKNNRLSYYTPGMSGENYIMEFKEYVEIFDVFTKKRIVCKHTIELIRFFNKFEITFLQILHKPIVPSEHMTFVLRCLSRSETLICYIENETDTHKLYNSAYYPKILGLADYIQTNMELKRDTIKPIFDLSYLNAHIQKSFEVPKVNKVSDFGNFKFDDFGHRYNKNVLLYLLDDNDMEFVHYNLKMTPSVKETYIDSMLRFFGGNEHLINSVRFEQTTDFFGELVQSKYFLSLARREAYNEYEYTFILKSLFGLPIIERNFFFKVGLMPDKIKHAYLWYYYKIPVKTIGDIKELMKEFDEDEKQYIQRRETIVSFMRESYGEKFKSESDLMLSKGKLREYTVSDFNKSRKKLYFADYNIDYNEFLNNF